MIFNTVYQLTKYHSIQNAHKKEKNTEFLEYKDKVYRKIWRGERRGKIGQYIEEKAFDRDSYGTDYNGYGWENHYNNYFMVVKDGKVLLDMYNKTKEQRKKRELTDEDIIAVWARSLVRKSDNEVSYEDALDIAREKLEYKRECVERMENRQDYRGYSIKRQKLINKMKRENPLRRIVDYNHAMAIISASQRHKNTDYEFYLEVGHDMEENGEIERGTAKEYAHQCLKYGYICEAC